MEIDVEDSTECPFYNESHGHEYCNVPGTDFCCCHTELNEDCPLFSGEQIVVKKS